MKLVFSRLIFLSILVLVPAFVYSFNITNLQTSVVGFANLGSEVDNDVNIVITKSLIKFLSKIPETEITAYENIQQTALETSFWPQRKMDLSNSFRFAQSFYSKIMITGNYQIDKYTKTIAMQVMVYDVENKKLELHRNYKGPAGLELFDTIDEMQKDIAEILIGRKISLTPLSINILDTKDSYTLNINDKLITNISRTSPYYEQFISGNPMKVVLYKDHTSNEVYHESFYLPSDMPKTINYQPSGTLLINIALDNAIIELDGKVVENRDYKKEIILDHISSLKQHTIVMKNGNEIIVEKKIWVTEGLQTKVFLDKKSAPETKDPDPSKKNQINPYINLLFPGIAQFQGNDTGAGYIFSGIGVLSMGLTVFSTVGIIKSNEKLSMSVTDNDKNKFASYSQIWGIMLGSGAVIYAGDLIISIFHAFNQSYVKKEPENSVNINIEPGKIELVFQQYF